MLAPIWILDAVSSNFAQLGIISTFVVLFLALVQAVTTSKPSETLAAVTAYSAVLLAFTQYSQVSSQPSQATSPPRERQIEAEISYGLYPQSLSWLAHVSSLCRLSGLGGPNSTSRSPVCRPTGASGSQPPHAQQSRLKRELAVSGTTVDDFFLLL